MPSTTDFQVEYLIVNTKHWIVDLLVTILKITLPKLSEPLGVRKGGRLKQVHLAVLLRKLADSVDKICKKLNPLTVGLFQHKQ